MAEPENERSAAEEAAAEAGGGEQPAEDAAREQLEAEIRDLRVEDVILQGAVSILNLSARRIAKQDERDLEQAKAGIEAARALAELVPEEARPQLRQAVSELQLLYAKHAGEPEPEQDEAPDQEPAEDGSE